MMASTGITSPTTEEKYSGITSPTTGQLMETDNIEEGTLDISVHDCSRTTAVVRNGEVSVRYEDYTKPYFNTDAIEDDKYQTFLRIAAAEELESLDNYYTATEDVGTYDITPDSGVHDLSSMDPELRAKLEEEWRAELAKTEDEIQTLKQVLGSKMRQAQELKRKLGITVWKEFRDDMEQGLKNIQETTAYQKTSQTIKTTSEKTVSALGTLSSNVTKKLGEMKNSTTFKSFEEKVGTAVTSVKTKMVGSRSNSTNSFEETLNSMEGRTSASVTPATTPSIPEEKPVA